MILICRLRLNANIAAMMSCSLYRASHKAQSSGLGHGVSSMKTGNAVVDLAAPLNDMIDDGHLLVKT